MPAEWPVAVGRWLRYLNYYYICTYIYYIPSRATVLQQQRLQMYDKLTKNARTKITRASPSLQDIF